MVGWHHWLNEFEQTLGDSENREAWHAAVPGVVKSQTWPRDGTAAKAGKINAPVSCISDTWEKCSCALTISCLGSGVGFSPTPETTRSYHPLTKQERLHIPLLTSRNAEPLWSLSVSLLHCCPLHRVSPHLSGWTPVCDFRKQTFWKDSGGHSRREEMHVYCGAGCEVRPGHWSLSFHNLQACVHCVWCSVAKWCPTLCNPVDRSLPGSSVCGIF